MRRLNVAAITLLTFAAVPAHASDFGGPFFIALIAIPLGLFALVHLMFFLWCVREPAMGLPVGAAVLLIEGVFVGWVLLSTGQLQFPANWLSISLGLNLISVAAAAAKRWSEKRSAQASASQEQ